MTLNTLTETLNSLLRGELAAVETYQQAVDKLGNTKGGSELRRIQAEHREAANQLRLYVQKYGGKADESSGIWGTFAKAVEGTAKLFGTTAALKALKEGEDLGIKFYEKVLHEKGVMADCETLIVSLLLPQTREHIATLDRLMAGLVDRISPQDARKRVTGSTKALLVCAYDNREDFDRNHLEGAIPLDHFAAQSGMLTWNQEIIFYCACPHEATAAQVAEEYQKKGFTNVKVLQGGVNAWEAADLPVLAYR